nr:S-adenosylmethionine carrier 1, chloroplastic/mitochondrial-like [Tanacetum cinerariifolium]
MSVNPNLDSSDTFEHKIYSSKDAPKAHVVSISKKADNPFDFVRVLLEGTVAGAAAGVVVEAALYPLDTIKTRLQAVRGGGQIVLKGLYSGLAGNLAGVLPASAISIGVYEPTKQKLLKSCPENFSALAHLTAGAVGGAASSIIRVPTEVVKQRMQTGHFASAPDAVRLIVAKEGFKGIFAGYSSCLLRDLPFDAIQFCLYEQLRIGYKLAAKRDLSDPENAVIGAFAGSGKPIQEYFSLCRHYSKGRRTFCISKGDGTKGVVDRYIQAVDPEIRKFIRSTGMKLEAIDSNRALVTFSSLKKAKLSFIMGSHGF